MFLGEMEGALYLWEFSMTYWQFALKGATDQVRASVLFPCLLVQVKFT